MFVHVVLFWLKAGASPDARSRLLEDCQTLLKEVSTVRQIWSGRPAMTPRDVVDNSYDVALCTVFGDQAGHDAYQVDPLHLQFIARNKDSWERVRVMDFV